jgi:hypothetical protein
MRRTCGLYLPADDRRHYIAWSDLTKEDFPEDCWTALWSFYENGGYAHVAAYLSGLDLTGFNPKAPPAKTEAFWAMVNANRPSEEAELNDVIDLLADHRGFRPEAITLPQVTLGAAGNDHLRVWLRNRKNRRIIPRRLATCGYEPVRNPDAQDGLWKINGSRQAVYARKELSLSERIKAAQKLARQ